jgi:hypothetical protein
VRRKKSGKKKDEKCRGDIHKTNKKGKYHIAKKTSKTKAM